MSQPGGLHALTWDDAPMVSGGPESADGALPAGTVTLLLADIEGSTRLWQDHAAEMPAAIARLDEIIDDAVARHRGVRPVEQGEGDSFVIAFALASDAAACALTLQQATANGLLRLRIGVHTGEVHRRNEGNYIGPAINRTARIRDAGHGGQTLLSQTTADIVADQLPERAWLVDLGERRLRDLDRPERIHQLAHPDLRATFPPLRGLDARRSNLPVQLSSFIGRAEVVAQLRDLLDQHRAVTLTGAGGCGKTRLALHMAALAEDYDGVYLVDFSPVNDGDALAALVAEAVGAQPQIGSSEVESLAAALRDTTTMLVFDNCEHVIAGCAGLADYLVRACPNLTVLATSREPLGVVGEITFRVPSLSEDEGVALFAERGARANARFALDDAT
ncbi:MAG TPA: adenylate/guanylate cyclase domain-containing protein, partial [Acidimicrobiales bacterium]|nr:adenylate/guanylate cyclase domain-containing protein [Acidimicrobiales bacterium]